MKSILYVVLAYLLIAAIGMAIGSRKVDTAIKRQRWLKYFSYVVIISILMAGIFLHFFYALMLFIILVGYYELIRAIEFYKNKNLAVSAIIIYSLISVCVLFFAFFSSQYLQFFIYFQVLTFDAFSQITGQLFGKHLITPKISPGKTVEGLIGGTIVCIISAIISGNWLHISLPVSIAAGLVTAMLSFSGDILASYFKRCVGIKDYSALLPGQGGFLDRFDSLLMTGAGYSFLLLQLKTIAY